MKRALITGANRGIGLELTRQLLGRGVAVVATCRSASPELEVTDAEVVSGIDVGDDGVDRKLVHALGDRPLDLLVNNAGILTRESIEDLDLDRIRRQFEINSLGPLRVTRALLPNLHRGSLIAIVTSLMGSMADNSSGGRYGYRMSKAAVNAAGVSLSHDLRERGIGVLILHPGMVATEMTGGRGISVEQSANGLLARIDAFRPQRTGTFWHADGRPLPW
ncbi:MAG: SDR family NAD(P)-dependent oxidoreductase [Acidobacteria bacterium]|nr:SDR family NAD(P)-dependent oxidoreductase [Acidobacteriota bacterium]NIM63631.1 SDR family NAD(P)-dependent oxidoreductase [Acidobacteriota bacterium]NIO59201.1 SDR family NAD(P)-dependent oxidoreductase [Acidobacteriota bacterium]NIQ30228.1 SDR family NAD(P)-dependent oxidoreductase [Acidobacteriota bacterium]NIQ85156.1 SDR family NAD(P)-dependent oxidoreductase [Acidobacteriota bacterium]